MPGLPASTFLSLKLHRFEYAVALLLTVALVVWGWSIAFRSDVSSISAACLDAWRNLGTAADPACSQAMRDWGPPIVNESPRLIAALAYVPFAAGLLAAAPIVARELEAGTARTAWSLYPDRAVWLAGVTLPIFVALFASNALLALVSEAVESARVVWGYSAVEDLDHYGIVLVADAMLGFAVALATGALLGRTLPGLVFATVIVIALAGGVGLAHDAWLRGLQPTVISEGSGPNGRELSPGSIGTGIAWRAPDGRQLTPSEALTIAHNAGAPAGAENDFADTAGVEWLESHGYVGLGLGVTQDTALSWRWLDAGAKTIVAVAFAAVAVSSVRRRRPR